MRKLAALLTLPVLLGGVIAADPVQPTPCKADSKYDVLGEGDTLEYASSGADFLTFQVDPTTDTGGRNKATATVTLTWDIPVNDYDLDVDGESSIGLQPIDAPMEQVFVTASGRCKTVTASWAEFLVATPDNLVLTVEVN